jgi:hypothetical protein
MGRESRGEQADPRIAGDLRTRTTDLRQPDGDLVDAPMPAASLSSRGVHDCSRRVGKRFPGAAGPLELPPALCQLDTLYVAGAARRGPC